MKKILLFLIMLSTAVFGIFRAQRDKPSFVEINEYVVDSELMRLIPLHTSVLDSEPQYMAVQALRLITDGHDSNRKIRRLAPENGRSMSVTLKGTSAVVDLRSEYFENRLQSRDLEKLFVYQVVNTLTSIDGIDRVTFTIDSEQRKKLAGFVDMREVFVPDHLV